MLPIYIRGESGIWYEWNGGLMVNLQHSPGGEDVDCFTMSVASFEMFLGSVEDAEMNHFGEEN